MSEVLFEHVCGRSVRRLMLALSALVVLSACGSDESTGDSNAAAGSAEVASAQPAAPAHPGRKIYEQACFSCHKIGLSGAPKLGDAEAWAPRVAKGMDLLLKSTKEGMGGMPPMGACMGCSDQDFIHAIEYMIENSQ